MSIAVFVGGRADLGPLTPVLSALAGTMPGEVRVLTAVGFDEAGARAALDEAGVTGVGVVAVGPRLTGDGPADAAGCGAAVSRGVAGVLAGMDVLVVLGDRWELPWVVMPAVLARVPVVHLHGGEVTEGAIDERVRHAVSKLADVHCVASQEARRRLLLMGEDEAAIHVTGAPGLDRLVGAGPAGEADLAALLGAPVVRPLALFTYHMVTTEPLGQVVANAVAALDGTADVAGAVIVTHPGPDPGGSVVRDALIAAAATRENVVVVPSLGARYPTVLAACDVVVGNSSSGVIEAASVGVPAVDVGNRQAGRLRAESVRHAEDGRLSVAGAVRGALAAPRGTPVANPYGDGHAAGRISAVVADAMGRAGAKRFREVTVT